MQYRLGIDIGGTFTDFSLFNEKTGEIRIMKVPSNAQDPEEAILNGLARIKAEYGIDPSEIGYFVHGTTLGVNTIIQRSGAETALLVTQGFRDILNLARHRIPDVFNFFTELPAPLVPRSRVFEIPERCVASGEITVPLNVATVRDVASEIKARGIKSVAVCFLHSYRNPEHEQQAVEILQEVIGDAYVSRSSEIWPQLREYERCLIAVINAYIGGRMKTYFGNLKNRLEQAGLNAPVLSTKSNGGVMLVDEAEKRPVETLLSGPASGVMGASLLGKAAGAHRLLAFDMGGTSADVAVVIDGEPQYSSENQVGDFPVILPAIDVSSIGAGGGSIAWTDVNGVLKVGPVSAGAAPGPAAYGQGGTEPTLTDAYVCLGIIGDTKPLGGTVYIDRERAKQAIGTIANVLGKSIHDTAEGILQIATSKMYSTLVPLMARKGVNFEEYTLLCFGGAGPTHGFLLAREAGIQRVLIPPNPGVMCAIGALAADMRQDFIRTMHVRLTASNEKEVMSDIKHAFADLTQQGDEWLNSQSIDLRSKTTVLSADMRYVGQSFELAVPLSQSSISTLNTEELKAAYYVEYDKVFGKSDSNAAIEIINVRVSAIGQTQHLPPPAKAEKGSAKSDPFRQREIHFDKRAWSALVAERSELAPGVRFPGPAVIEQYDTTIFVPPGFSAYVDDLGNIIGERDENR